jgi:hypothetical protein
MSSCHDKVSFKRSNRAASSGDALKEVARESVELHRVDTQLSIEVGPLSCSDAVDKGTKLLMDGEEAGDG